MVSSIFVEDLSDCERDERGRCKTFEVEVLVALEIVITQTTEVEAVGSVNVAVYADNYDEEEAEQLIEFDVSAWMPPELEQQFTQLAFQTQEVATLALEEKFALPNQETMGDAGAMGIGLSTEVKELTYNEMAARYL